MHRSSTDVMYVLIVKSFNIIAHFRVTTSLFSICVQLIVLHKTATESHLDKKMLEGFCKNSEY